MSTAYETYGAIKSRHQKEMNSFKDIFFAFSNEQFTEGMTNFGLSLQDTDKIISIGAGGYILKSKKQEFLDLLERLRAEMKEFKKEQSRLVEAIAYELANHEYIISGDVEPALNALGIEINELDKEILKKAIKLHNSRI